MKKTSKKKVQGSSSKAKKVKSTRKIGFAEIDNETIVILGGGLLVIVLVTVFLVF